MTNKIQSLNELRDNPEPEEKFDYSGGIYKINEKGVFHIGFDKEGNETSPLWLSSPIKIKALTRDSGGKEWGRLLEWKDKDGRLHDWAMPIELLQGDGLEVRKELSGAGLSVAPSIKARNLFNMFLQIWPVERRARCTQKLGWHNGFYVMPGLSIGDDSETVVFQNQSPVEPAFEESGSLEEWRENVAALAVGNTRLVFSVSAAFAGPLLQVLNIEGGGFHFRGGSSSGKTTTLYSACSVWGGHDFKRSWKATGNAIEGQAALHNDNLLILDEIKEANPFEVGQTAYMLANGQGKGRANKSGLARKAATWRLIFLSSGELSLPDLMKSAGQRAYAGQEVRIVDIPSDAGAGMGMFQEIHGQKSPGAFADHMNDMTAKFHGVAGVTFLKGLHENKAEITETAKELINEFVEELAIPETAAQAGRVARRFALVAVAGEIVSAMGITGWSQDEAKKAAKECFQSWLKNRGGYQNQEETTILNQVKAFFEAHESSRFESITGSDEQKIINRVGFWRYRGDNKEYLVFPEAFKNEVCKGLDYKESVKVLKKAGWLEVGREKASQVVHIAGKLEDQNGNPIAKRRFYVFNSCLWGS